MQELIEEYDDQGIGIAGPFAKRKSFKSKPEAFTGVADALPEGSTDNVYVDLESIKDGLRSEVVRSKGQGLQEPSCTICPRARCSCGWAGLGIARDGFCPRGLSEFMNGWNKWDREGCFVARP